MSRFTYFKHFWVTLLVLASKLLSLHILFRFKLQTTLQSIQGFLRWRSMLWFRHWWRLNLSWTAKMCKFILSGSRITCPYNIIKFSLRLSRFLYILFSSINKVSLLFICIELIIKISFPLFLKVKWIFQLALSFISNWVADCVTLIQLFHGMLVEQLRRFGYEGVCLTNINLQSTFWTDCNTLQFFCTILMS
jgi:hypothetical protein